MNSSYAKQYHMLIESRKPAVYIEIENFSRVFFICMPCLQLNGRAVRREIIVSNKGFTTSHIDVPYFRQFCIKVYLNFQGTKFASGERGNETYRIKAYFSKGHKIPCSPSARIIGYFDENECALIMTGMAYNFTLILQKVGIDTHLHSFHFLIQRAFLTHKLIGNRQFGTASPAYGIGLNYYEFTVLHEKKHLRENDLEMHGILAPFPWWVLVTVVLVSFGTSILLFKKLGIISFGTFILLFKKLGIILIPANMLTSWFGNAYALLDQSASTIPGVGDGIEKLKLWSTWSFFCLIILMPVAYRGFLFSSLAVTTTPSIPGGLNELVDTSMLVGGLDYYWRGNLTYGMVLPEVILPERGLLMKRKEVYLKLQRSIKWFTDHIVHISLNISRSRTTSVGFPRLLTDIPEYNGLTDIMGSA